MISRICTAYLFCWILISCYTGRISSASVHVTLDSIAIFQTHEWFKKPTVYFQCKRENRTVLPDVKEANVTYKFKGQESWQPLTNFTSEKCKRCGFYEQDLIPPDDIFEEWELCPSDFSQSDGKYFHVKEKEFNATFFCEECVASHNTTSTASNNSARVSHKYENGMRKSVIIAISVVVSVGFIIGFVVIYKYLVKQRRAQEQARFMKLFEDSDDIEEELEMSHII